MLKNKIKLFSLQRGGTHAVGNWIRPHFENIKYFNDWNEKKIETKEIENYENILISYENKEISEKLLKTNNFDSEKSYCIIVLRDYYNLLASRLEIFLTSLNSNHRKAYHYLKKNKVSLLETSKQFRHYAEKMLSKFSEMSNYKIIRIKFNDWFESRNYREKKAKEFGCILNDDNLQIVEDYGGGSSFDKREYNLRAQEMKVLERWKKFQNEPFYHFLLYEDEAQRLNKKLFKKRPFKPEITFFLKSFEV